ncbi:hypothetical protein J6590_005199 [Homalodisca vitripennis]|nr:hypothetical protein J6590_005199 [Homalodisca vitripennis]
MTLIIWSEDRAAEALAHARALHNTRPERSPIVNKLRRLAAAAQQGEEDLSVSTAHMQRRLPAARRTCSHHQQQILSPSFGTTSNWIPRSQAILLQLLSVHSSSESNRTTQGCPDVLAQDLSKKQLPSSTDKMTNVIIYSTLGNPRKPAIIQSGDEP